MAELISSGDVASKHAKYNYKFL